MGESGIADSGAPALFIRSTCFIYENMTPDLNKSEASVVVLMKALDLVEEECRAGREMM